jgi:DNA-binding MarR family transcriptional regulator
MSLFLVRSFASMIPYMSIQPSTKKPRRPKSTEAPDAGRTLDLDRYVPALITFIANKLSRSATVLYQKRFGVNVTEWRILALLAIEPAISAARICHVIGYDKGPVSRTLAVMEERGLVTIRTDKHDGRTHAISLTPKGRSTHDRVIALALERERRLLSCLRNDEREALINLLVRIHGNLDAVTAPIKS